eukprot:1053612-Karenia_brevis.AAC.1
MGREQRWLWKVVGWEQEPNAERGRGGGSVCFVRPQVMDAILAIGRRAAAASSAARNPSRGRFALAAARAARANKAKKR